MPFRRTVGRLSSADLVAFEEKLAACLLSDTGITDYLLTRVDLATLPGGTVQGFAEKSVRASVGLAARGDPAIDLVRLRSLLPP